MVDNQKLKQSFNGFSLFIDCSIMIANQLLLIPLILLGALLPISAETDQNGIIYYNTQNTTNGSALYNNIQQVLAYLVNSTHLSNGTYYCHGNSPDDACGISICYNNISSGDCTKCLRSSRTTIQQYAPLAIGARYTTTNCRLHYENQQFNDSDFGAPSLAPSPSSPPSSAPSSSSSPSSAPSPTVSPDTKGQQSWKVVVIVVAVGVCIVVILSTYCIWKRSLKKVKTTRERGSLEDGVIPLSYDDLKSATNNFDEANAIGQGGFGKVYKGVLQDGTELAIKQLSLQSAQGRQSFLNEVKIIRSVQHRNLVKLIGYCTEGEHYLLAYEYMENRSLDQAIRHMHLDWKTRWNIALGVARGLAYLHEDSQQGIVHRDIKSSNILLDNTFQPKISDFGLSKLFEQDRSTSLTLVAGTYGYLAPEYVMKGILSVKVDVFSFGIVLLEIISGRKCQDHTLEPDYILDWAWSSYENESLGIIDSELGKSYSKTEATKLIHLALLCTQDDPGDRPSMSLVVAILRGYANQPATNPKKPQSWRNIIMPNVNSNSNVTTNQNMFTLSKVSYNSFQAR